MLTGIPNILSSHLISFQRELKNWLVSNLASSINVFSGSNEDLLAQDFKGANSLITSGGSPLRMEVRIFFSCSFSFGKGRHGVLHMGLGEPGTVIN